jgi:hypothetical protein
VAVAALDGELEAVTVCSSARIATKAVLENGLASTVVPMSELPSTAGLVQLALPSLELQLMEQLATTRPSSGEALDFAAEVHFHQTHRLVGRMLSSSSQLLELGHIPPCLSPRDVILEGWLLVTPLRNSVTDGTKESS